MVDWKEEIRHRLASLKLEPTREAEIVEELAQHLEDRYAELLASCATEKEAVLAVLAELSESEALQQDLRRVEQPVNQEPVVLGVGRTNMIADLWQDLRYSVRSMRKHAFLSIAVVATLTLGIGISTGVFTYFNAAGLRANVDKDFDSFVRVYSAYTKDATRPGRPAETTLEDYLALRDGTKSLRNLAAYADFYVPMGTDPPVEVRALLVTSNFFSVYDLEQPLLGRLLEPEDYAAVNPVVVFSERLWRNRFAADPQIVGKVVHFNGQPVTVVGVTPNFAGMVNSARAWFPYTLETYLKHCVIAVSLALIGIYGVVAFAVSQRTKEMGIRLALGATTKDIYQAILGTSSRPVALGLLLGLAITVATCSAIAQLLRGQEFSFDVAEPTAYAATAVLLACVALTAMLIPARRATKVDPMVSLREE
jgi:MacB-like periplasmic core domain/FtsX-like permease family